MGIVFEVSSLEEMCDMMCNNAVPKVRSELTEYTPQKYNKGDPVRCECGKIIAYKKDGKLMLYCKQCKRQIPIEPEP